MLDSDSDPEDNPLSAELVSPSEGTLTLNRNGSFSYTPPAGYAGTDFFTYRASDGTLPTRLPRPSLSPTTPPPRLTMPTAPPGAPR